MSKFRNPQQIMKMNWTKMSKPIKKWRKTNLFKDKQAIIKLIKYYNLNNYKSQNKNLTIKMKRNI